METRRFLGAAQRLTAAAFVAAVAIAATFAVQHGGPVLAPFGVGLALFVMAGALIDLTERTLILRVPLRRGAPPRRWIAAFGLGHGDRAFRHRRHAPWIVVVTAWGAEHIAALKPGETIDIAHYRLTFDGLFNRPGPNYRECRPFHRTPDQRRPARRHGAEPPHFSRAQHGDHRGGVDAARRQPALSLARRSRCDGTVPVRLYFKPLVLLIWLGALIMFVGGGLSLSDRRLRIGAPRPTKMPVALRAAE